MHTVYACNNYYVHNNNSIQMASPLNFYLKLKSNDLEFH